MTDKIIIRVEFGEEDFVEQFFTEQELNDMSSQKLGDMIMKETMRMLGWIQERRLRDNKIQQMISPTSQWFKSAEDLPDVIGSMLIVKMISGEICYAIYSAENEFDVNRHNGYGHRKSWEKWSRMSVIEWKYLDTES